MCRCAGVWVPCDRFYSVTPFHRSPADGCGWRPVHYPLPSTRLYCSSLQATLTLRRLGEEQGIPELTRREIPLGTVDGHYLAAIGAGVCDSDAYYRGPYEGGAVFLLLTGLPSRQPAGMSPALRAANVFAQVISSCSVDHRRAFEAYMQYRGAQCQPTPGGLTCSFPHGEGLKAEFDSLGRLANLEAISTPAAVSSRGAADAATPAPAQKRPWWKPGAKS